MRILLAPDSFKENLTAEEFCNIAEKGISSILPETQVVKVPLSDGGEGTVEVLIANGKGTRVELEVFDPIMNKIKAVYGLVEEEKLAIIEMASASGLPLLESKSRNPMVTSTYGTGQLILDALDKGCKTIILGLGGSATNDCGLGILEALGARLYNSSNEKIPCNGRGICELNRIDVSGLDIRLKDVSILVACDVDNPLFGPDGAAYVYAPQKGATPEMVELLDCGLRNFANVVKKEFGIDVTNLPGSGAAGGLGAMLSGILKAELRPGFEIISEVLELEKIIASSKFDLIITGEGQINSQTLNGKLPVRIAGLGKKYDIPTIAIVGSVGDVPEEIYKTGIVSIFSIINKPLSLKEALATSKDLLLDTIKRIMRLYCMKY